MIFRREFLRSMSGVAACALASNGARAGTAKPAIDLGFSLYGMKELPLADALRTCAEIGYRNVELCLLPGYPTAPSTMTAVARREFREMLRAHGLSISGALIEMHLAATPEGLHASPT
jgi:hypothetical protein